MRVLVLGGTHHVGRAVVEVALRRGDAVTTLNRGLSRPPAPGVEALVADRTDPDAVRRALGGRSWDAVIDTWAWAPRVVADSARLLAGRAGHYGYVSSRAVYAWPWPAGADESAPLVAGDPGGQDGGDYAAAKRGGELAVAEAFGERALLARAGMILGPYEDVGRMPWWLRRLERENFPLGMEFGLRYPGDPHPTGLHDADVSAALAAGLTLRPLRETLADTWAWLRREGDPAPRPDTPSPAQWFDPVQERHVLELARSLM
ncbi:reductase [Nonomuraea sp. FMUSA5-5]|uniref:Reductase n=1 Tax=Nonomuraea composti TaxID=2720023 RepID=A0ABX1BA07_9ACTN|nr:NAD-dependent epimerase/dehydratase family protein [Nonomuraea sp. FMUSA5-5]NJP93149.1 reductase [Nonomuraea sp. FMUSA5-5]